MSKLADYLAKNYLTADPAPEDSTRKKSSSGKKRKRKGIATDAAAAGGVTTATSGLIIADDDDDVLGWADVKGGNQANGDDDGPVDVSASRSAEFRRSKKSSWKTVGAPAPSSAEQLAADEILASAVAEQTARREAEDAEDAEGADGAVVEKHDEPRMASGARAGLQTAAQVSEATAERAAEERRQFEMLGAGPSGTASAAAAAELAHETIYRDASGRIINIAMKRAEARKAAEEVERKKRVEVDARKGDVQQAERAQRKVQLEDAKYMTVARHADDKEMNEQLRERERWDDPAAGFLTKKKKEKKSVTGKPVYQGAAPPNRYGIKPGHRWDGVDRGNGFEKQYFKAKNKRRDQENLEYAWQMDE